MGKESTFWILQDNPGRVEAGQLPYIGFVLTVGQRTVRLVGGG